MTHNPNVFYKPFAAYQNKTPIELRVTSLDGYTIASLPMVYDDSLAQAVLAWGGEQIEWHPKTGFGDKRLKSLLPVTYVWHSKKRRNDFVSVRSIAVTFDDGIVVVAYPQAQANNTKEVWVYADNTHDLRHDSNPHPNLGLVRAKYELVMRVLDYVMSKTIGQSVRAVVV